MAKVGYCKALLHPFEEWTSRYPNRSISLKECERYNICYITNKPCVARSIHRSGLNFGLIDSDFGVVEMLKDKLTLCPVKGLSEELIKQLMQSSLENQLEE